MAELLRAGRRRVHGVWIANESSPAPILQEMVDLAGELRVAVRRVGRAEIERLAATQSHQGVVARADPLPVADLDVLCRGAEGATDRGSPLLLALDGVTDPRNLGALLRSADGAGATGAVLPEHRSVHVSAAAAKAAAGAIEHVPIALVGGIPAALARARDLGCWVVGLAEDGATSIFGTELDLAPEPLVVVVGSEASGLSRLARSRCDLLVSVPMAGAIPSLNAAAAGTLALYEIARRRSRQAAQ